MILSRCLRTSFPCARSAEAGYEGIELGPYGYLPDGSGELKEQLDEHGMGVLAGHGVRASAPA